MRCSTPAGRAELVGLDLADVSIAEENGKQWGKLTVRHGKGNKERSLAVAGGALDALQDWLIVRGDAAGPLFVPINKGGVLALDRRLTSQAIYDLLAKRGAAAKLADFSPHDLRRTFISDLLDIATVRPTTAVFEKWRPWLKFTEHPAGQQNHLPKNQAQRTKSAVFWVAESQRCFFRLRFGLGGLGAIGRISWHDEEIRIEGRISPLTIASPWIVVIWFDVFVVAAYLLDEAPHNVKTLVSLVGLITAVIVVTFGLVYLMQAFLERLYFRRAYQEIKARIWSAA